MTREEANQSCADLRRDTVQTMFGPYRWSEQSDDSWGIAMSHYYSNYPFVFASETEAREFIKKNFLEDIRKGCEGKFP